MMRFASATVVGSGRVGPDASAGSFPTGTSLTASVIFVALCAAAAEPPAFHGGDVFPDRIDCLDRCATGHQRPMHILYVFERLRGVQRQLHESRCASRKQKENQRLLIALFQQR